MKERVSVSKDNGLIFERFTFNQRLQHFITVVTFTVCAVTGLPIRYYTTGWAQGIASLFGGFDPMFYTHVTSGIIMILAFIYHLIYLAGYAIFNGPSFAILPTLEDLKNLVQDITYDLGLVDEPAEHGRYNLDEKVEYLSVIWGTVLMGFSGLVMFYPHISANFMPRWLIEVLRMAHSGEAVLAVLAIVVSHLYDVHLSPDFFPMNRVWLTGKFTEEEMEHEHPKEMEKIMANVSSKEELKTTNKTLNSMKHSDNRFLISIELIIYVGAFIMFLWYFLPKALGI